MKNLKVPLIIKFPINHQEMKGVTAPEMIKRQVLCAYQNDWDANWNPLETTCKSSMYEKLQPEEFICCASHMTSFAVGQVVGPTNLSHLFAVGPTNPSDLFAGTIILMNALLLVTLGFSVFCDACLCCVYKKAG